jgi:hypothetical protein
MGSKATGTHPMKNKIVMPIVSVAFLALGIGGYLWFKSRQVTSERAQKHCACLVLLDQSAADCEQWTRIQESAISRPSPSTLQVGEFKFDISSSETGCRFLNVQK